MQGKQPGQSIVIRTGLPDQQQDADTSTTSEFSPQVAFAAAVVLLVLIILLC